MANAAKHEPTNVPRCLMVDAIEGPAISYWAEVRNVKRAPDLDVISFEVRDAGFEGPRQSEEWVTVNEQKVIEAAKRMRDGEFEVARRIMGQFCGKEWDYDAEGVDCVIQAICFGKIIFG